MEFCKTKCEECRDPEKGEHNKAARSTETGKAGNSVVKQSVGKGEGEIIKLEGVLADF